MAKKIRGRLAPSPTGALHLGNARTFLLTWLLARKSGGEIILRMEDLDHPKVKPETKQEALDDLRWLGLDWDEGPDCGGEFMPYTQSERLGFYKEKLEILVGKGLVYPCVCTRKELENIRSAPHLEDYAPNYPGICRDRFKTYDDAKAAIDGDRLPAWRFKVPDREVFFTDGFHGEQRQNVFKSAGDFIIARDEYGAGYQLAVVADDAEMGITQVVRGDDLLECTHWQILLYEAFGTDVPEFIHVPLVVGEDGKRLAKRHGDTRISLLRKSGAKPEKLVGLLAHWSGMAEFGEELTCNELLSRFSLEKIPQGKIVVTAKDKKYLGF